jgi:glycosyltransferase involved in cell wall biosynthesis
MKIGILVDEIAPGSAPKLLAYPIKYLKKINIKAEAIVLINNQSTKNKKYLSEYLKKIKVRYLFDNFPKIFKFINFKFPMMSFFSLHHILGYFFAYKSIKNNEFDIILAHCQYSAFSARNLKLKYNLPYILLLWDPSTYTANKIYKKKFSFFFPILIFLSKILDNFALRESQSIITSGKYHHSYLKKITGKKIYVLRPGCEPLKSIKKWEERKPIIIAWDRWDIGNDPINYLEIIKKIKRKDIKLKIAGFWHPLSLKNEFIKKIKEYNLEKRIIILGSLNDIEIKKLCSEASLHLHLIHEAYGMQTLEAAACGCPSIIPEGSGVCELFKNKVSGIFPKINKTNLFVKEIDKFFFEKNYAKKMSLACWSVSKKNTWKDYAENLKKIAVNNLKKK